MGVRDTLLVALALGLGGLFSWWIRSRYEEFRELERGLSDRRREIYEQLIAPFVKLFGAAGNPDLERQVQAELTPDQLRSIAFNLALIGSDDVVRAFNDMMREFYRASSGGLDAPTAVQLLGRLLLEIRRSLGNKGTKLSEWDMLRALISDLEAIEHR